MIKYLAALAACLAASAADAHPDHSNVDRQPPWQAASDWPDRIITTITEDPARSFSVSWRTDSSVGEAIAQIALATPDARFDLNVLDTNKATTEHVRLDQIEGPDGPVHVLQNHGLPPVHYHSLTFEELEPDTLYAWRVRGARGRWSPWRQLRTAPLAGPIQFIFFGDAQTAIRSHVTRTFDAASIEAPKARFAIHGGDLVNTAMYDQEWAEWFGALGRTHQMIPSVLVAGNHDYVNFDKDEEDPKLFEVENKTVAPVWRPQFALPVEPDVPEALRETVYDVRYHEDLHLFVLDSSGVDFDGQLRWLEQRIAASDARWKLLAMHHPLHAKVAGNEHPAHLERREALLATMERTKIDLVVTGHRHSYQRGVYGEDVARFAAGEEQTVDTVFIITASSTKRGQTKPDVWAAYTQEMAGDVKLSRHGDNTPIYAVFDLDGDRLTYRALDPTGALYDGFTLEKRDGRKILIDDPIVGTEPRTRANTGRYIGWDDLR